METKDAAAGFAALSQETRLGLMRLLATRGPTGMAAGELAAQLRLAPSTLSFHLSALEQAGLVRSMRQGRNVIYAVRLARMRPLFEFLVDTCCIGRPDLYGDFARLLPDDVLEERGLTPAFNVIFLCTHNSARSIMAEAILDKVGRDRFHAYSAGAEPARRPMPAVIERLQQLGHDVSRLRSKSWNEFTNLDAPRMNFALSLCDASDGQVCPEFGGRPVTAAWPFPDPAKFKGSPIECASNLDALYGMIRRRLEIFVNLAYAALDPTVLRARLAALGDPTKFA